MGINDEYSRDAYNYEQVYDSDDSVDSPDPIHPEDWQDWYSEQLLDAWMTIRQMAEQDYTQVRTGFPQFVEFVMDPADLYTENDPSQRLMAMWTGIKDIQVIRENIQIENFIAWANINIG
jgi:hypothetical protein